MNSLAALDELKARIVEMRFFGRLIGEVIAAAVGISTPTVTREIRMAQVWLYRQLRG